MSKITTMAEFAAAKRALVAKWGERLIQGTPAEMAAIAKEAEPLAKFARLRPEKFLWALGQDWVNTRPAAAPGAQGHE